MGSRAAAGQSYDTLKLFTSGEMLGQGSYGKVVPNVLHGVVHDSEVTP